MVKFKLSKLFYILALEGILLHEGVVWVIMRRCKMEKLKPEQAVELLRKKGIEVSLEQAGVILDFLRLLANIMVSEYLKKP